MPIYTPGTPPANQVLATTQPLLQGNLDYLAQTGNIDHFYSNNTLTTNNGFHQGVHLINQNPVPTVGAGVGAIYSSTIGAVGGGQQLFYAAPSGSTTQLTNSKNTNPGVNGSTTLTDGVFMIWGTVITGLTSGSVSFSPVFTTVYNIQATLINNAAPNGNGTISITQGATGGSFNWELFTSSGAYVGFYWSAIGTA